MSIISKLKSLFCKKKEDYSWVEKEPLYKEIEGKLQDLENKKAEEIEFGKRVYSIIGVKNYERLSDFDKRNCRTILECLDKFEVHRKDFSLIAILALMIVEKGGTIPEKFVYVSPFIRTSISLSFDAGDVQYIIAPYKGSFIRITKDMKCVPRNPTGNVTKDYNMGISLYLYAESLKTLCEDFEGFKNRFFRWLKSRG
jgi:hypothetical protein